MKLFEKINPIIKREIKVSSRSVKLSIELFVFEVALCFIFFMLSLSLSDSALYFRLSDLSTYLVFFPTLGVIEAIMIGLVMPILTASSITSERERQTLDLMLTTPLSPMRIVLGKLFSSVIRTSLFVFASIPVMSIPFLIGGLSWGYLFTFLLCLFVFAIFAGSMGIFCSAISNSTIPAILKVFIFYFVFFFLTIIPILTTSNAKHIPIIQILILLINPAVIFEEDLVLTFSPQSIFGAKSGYTASIEDFYYYISLSKNNPFANWIIFKGPCFAILSGIALLLLSYLFLRISAKRLDPKYAKDKKYKKKKKTE